MKSMSWVFTLLLIVLMSMISIPAVAADPVVLDDDLKEIEARFNAELEKMRNQFREELQRAQDGPRNELIRAQNRIRELEAENASLKEDVSVATAKIETLTKELASATGQGAAVSNSRGYLGISIVEIEANQARQLEVEAAEAVIVESVEAGSSASDMGLKPGDAIFAIDGQVASYDNLVAILSGKKAGDSVTAAWARSGSDGVVKVRGRGILKSANDVAAAQQVTRSDPPAVVEDPAPVHPPSEPVATSGITFGVNVLQAEGFGLQITSVEPGSNAAVAGIQVGDIVTAFGDAKVRTIEGLRDVLASTVVGSRGQIIFSRGGEPWVTVIQFGGGDLAATLIDGPNRPETDIRQTIVPPRNGRGFLGIVPVERGDAVVVSEVVVGSCAEQMGLRQGDLLVAVAGKIVTSIDVLRAALAPRNVGDSIEVRFARSGEPRSVQGVLGKFPASEGQASVIDSIDDLARPVPSSARIEAPKSSGNSKLGIVVAWDADGAYIDTILPGSGAGSAGVLIGDRIIRVEDVAIGSLEQIGEVLSHTMTGSPVSLELLRGNEPLTLVAHRGDLAPSQQLSDTVMAMAMANEPPVLGIEVEENAIGILLTEIHEGSSAQEAGLQRGDWIIRICEMEVRTIEDMQDSLQYSGLLEIEMTIRRDLEIFQVTIPLQRR